MRRQSPLRWASGLLLLQVVVLASIASTCEAWVFSPKLQSSAVLHSRTRTLRSLPFVDEIHHDRRQEIASLHSQSYNDNNNNNKKSHPWTKLLAWSRTGQRPRRSPLGRAVLGTCTLALLVVAATLFLSPKAAVASTLAEVVVPATAATTSTTTAAGLAATPTLASTAATFAVEPVVAAATAAATTTPAIISPPLLLPPPIPLSVEIRLSVRLLFASLLGAAVGKERSSTHKHSAGVRTMALVALGACAFTVCSSFGFLHTGRCDPSRMASNVASGVGFVGAGVITTTSANPTDSRQSIVHGLTTATAIWISAAIGVSCGVGMLYISTLATVLTITILRFGRVKSKFRTGASQAHEWVQNQRQETPSVAEIAAGAKIRLNALLQGSVSQPQAVADTTTHSTNLQEQQEQQQQQPQQQQQQQQQHELESITSSNASLEEFMEKDEWDSHVESVESPDPEEEGTSKEDALLHSDPDVAEFHSIAQASILGVAHTASLGNFTGIFTHSGDPYHQSQKNHSFHDTPTSEEYLRHLEPSRISSRSLNSGSNETLAP